MENGPSACLGKKGTFDRKDFPLLPPEIDVLITSLKYLICEFTLHLFFRMRDEYIIADISAGDCQSIKKTRLVSL